jgi:transposase
MINREKFTIAVPARLKWVQEIIDDVDYDIQNPEHYRDFDGEVLYTCTKLHYWGKNHHQGYAHVYYNSHIAAEAADKFNRELLEYKKELESGSLVKEHQNAYNTFFIIKNPIVRGSKISFNNKMVQKYRKKYSGYYVLFSNSIKDSDEALQVYRDKASVEKCFDDLKNRLDMKRLRVHSAPVMESRIFVQFISLIYLSELRNIMRRSGLDKKYSARDILLEMETLSEITYSGKYGKIYTEATKQQKEILDKFNISLEA